MIEIFNKKFFLRTGYKVTFEPVRTYEKEIQKKLNWAYNVQQSNKVSNRDLSTLIQYSEDYPEVPQFKNHLFLAYKIRREHEKAAKFNEQFIKDFPDYLFAKLNAADILIQEDKFEEAIDLLGKPRRIENLLKEEIMHISQFRGYNYIAGILDTHEEDYDMAKKRANWLHYLEPDNALHKAITRKIIAKTSIFVKMQQEEKYVKEVETFPKVKFTQQRTHTALNHSTELAAFFETKYNTIPDNYEQILQLPRTSLIEDLENILLDSCRLNDFYQEKEDYSEMETSFLFHAAYFLGHLENSASLPIILDVFRQGEDYIEFWYGDYFNNVFEPILYKLAKTEKEWKLLLDYVLEENIVSESKNCITEVISKLILSEQMPRDIGLKWFQQLLNHIFENLANENFLDTLFISSLASDIVSVKLSELLPEIKKLCDLNLVLPSFSGGYKDLEKTLHQPVKSYDLPVEYTSIIHFYNPPSRDFTDDIADFRKPIDDDMFTDEELGIDEDDVFGEMSSLLAAFGDGNFDSEDDEYYEDDYEEKAVRLASPRNETFVNTDKKVGRNDPCPCGSGKKYKKCHGKK